VEKTHFANRGGARTVRKWEFWKKMHISTKTCLMCRPRTKQKSRGKWWSGHLEKVHEPSGQTEKIRNTNWENLQVKAENRETERLHAEKNRFRNWKITSMVKSSKGLIEGRSGGEAGRYLTCCTWDCVAPLSGGVKNRVCSTPDGSARQKVVEEPPGGGLPFTSPSSWGRVK